MIETNRPRDLDPAVQVLGLTLMCSIDSASRARSDAVLVTDATTCDLDSCTLATAAASAKLVAVRVAWRSFAVAATAIVVHVHQSETIAINWLVQHYSTHYFE